MPADSPHHSTTLNPPGSYLGIIERRTAWMSQTHLYSVSLLDRLQIHRLQTMSSRLLNQQEANSQMIFVQKLFNKRWFTIIKIQAKHVFSNCKHMAAIKDSVHQKGLFMSPRKLVELRIIIKISCFLYFVIAVRGMCDWVSHHMQCLKPNSHRAHLSLYHR